MKFSEKKMWAIKHKEDGKYAPDSFTLGCYPMTFPSRQEARENKCTDEKVVRVKVTVEIEEVKSGSA